jgi:1,4-dihydroxy-2-naphthoyl-CoA hydrolase
MPIGARGGFSGEDRAGEPTSGRPAGETRGAGAATGLTVGFTAHLGCRVDGAADGVSHVHVPVGPELLNPSGTVHGGVYAALADVALSRAVLSLLERPAPIRLVALNLNLLRELRDGVMQAEGRVLHRGRSSFFGEVRLTDSAGETLGFATATIVALAGTPAETQKGDPRP